MSIQRRKRIALDCDGVLAEWTAYVIKRLGIELSVDDVDDFSLRNVLRARFGKDVARKADVICSDNDFTRTQPQLPWAKELVQLSFALGDVMVLTSPWESKGWYDARVEWLRRELGIHQGQLMAGRLKPWVAADFFVDDKPKNIIEWATDNPNGFAVLLAWPYNVSAEELLPANAKRMSPDELIQMLRRGQLTW